MESIEQQYRHKTEHYKSRLASIKSSISKLNCLHLQNLFSLYFLTQTPHNVNAWGGSEDQ
jgi:hypothetical protein